MGHKSFAVISGATKNNDRALDRLQGFKTAVENYGFTIPEERIIECNYSVKKGREAMHKILLQNDLPTAVLCGNDIIALGAISAAQSAGVKIPDDISITGFDDIDMSSQIIPALSTVHVPSKEMGKRAADYLIEQLQSDEQLPSSEIQTELRIRGTTDRAINN